MLGLRWILSSTTCKRHENFKKKLPFTSGESCGTPALNDKVIFMSGASSGLGAAAAEYLKSVGADVHCASRSKGKFDEEHFYKLDLSDLDSVDRCAELFLKDHPNCDTFVLCSGVLDPSGKMSPTKNGCEVHFGINYIGHYRLIQKILPALKANKGRVVIVSSLTAQLCSRLELIDEAPYTLRKGFSAYGQSKLAIAMMVKELARQNPEVGFYAVDPGIVRTGITRTIPGFIDRLWAWLPIAPTPDAGCQTILECVMAPKHELGNGCVFRNCKIVAQRNSHNYTEDATSELYKRTFKLVAQFMDELAIQTKTK